MSRIAEAKEANRHRNTSPVDKRTIFMETHTIHLSHPEDRSAHYN
jgi:hypothetical protein